MPKIDTPTLESFFPQAQTIARRIAWIEADIDDLVQEGMIELWSALQSPSTPIQSYPAFASRVFVRKMQNFYSKGVRGRLPEVELRPEIYPTLERKDDQLLSRIELENFFDAIEMYEGKTERWIVESLLSIHGDLASTPTALVRSCLLAGLQSKEILKLLAINFPKYKPGQRLIHITREKLREQKLLDGMTPLREISCEAIRISHRQLRESLSLSVPAWFEILARVREFTQTWFA